MTDIIMNNYRNCTMTDRELSGFIMTATEQ